MPVFRLVAAKPSLFPLLMVVGGTITTSVAFAIRYVNHPDVVVKKDYEAHPWNAVSQAHNSKLFSYSPEFWLGRAQIPDPRAAFLQDAGDATSIARVKKARKYKSKKNVEPVVSV